MENDYIENDYIENISRKYGLKFGKIAVDKGFITETQLKEALAEQANNNKLIGIILFEYGWVTKVQVDIILDILSKEPV